MFCGADANVAIAVTKVVALAYNNTGVINKAKVLLFAFADPLKRIFVVNAAVAVVCTFAIEKIGSDVLRDASIVLTVSVAEVAKFIPVLKLTVVIAPQATAAANCIVVVNAVLVVLIDVNAAVNGMPVFIDAKTLFTLSVANAVNFI